MAKGKYNYRLVEEGGTWTAQITRKITSKKIGVSKSKSGFDAESAAKDWAETELAVFLEKLAEQHKRRAIERERAEEKNAGDNQ